MSAGLLAFHECFIEAERLELDELDFGRRPFPFHHHPSWPRKRDKLCRASSQQESRYQHSFFCSCSIFSLGARRKRSSHTTRKKKKKIGEGGDLFPFFFQRRLRAERYGKNGAIVAGGQTGRVTTANDKLSPYYSRNASG